MATYRQQIKYIAWSPDRGWCGHLHKSRELAEKCAAADGPGDRQAFAVDAGAAKRDQREIDRVWFNRGRGLYYRADAG